MIETTDILTPDQIGREIIPIGETVFINGLAAPLFLLLAGVALAMAAESRARKIGAAAASTSSAVASRRP